MENLDKSRLIDEGGKLIYVVLPEDNIEPDSKKTKKIFETLSVMNDDCMIRHYGNSATFWMRDYTGEFE